MSLSMGQCLHTMSAWGEGAGGRCRMRKRAERGWHLHFLLIHKGVSVLQAVISQSWEPHGSTSGVIPSARSGQAQHDSTGIGLDSWWQHRAQVHTPFRLLLRKDMWGNHSMHFQFGMKLIYRNKNKISCDQMLFSPKRNNKIILHLCIFSYLFRIPMFYTNLLWNKAFTHKA